MKKFIFIILVLAFCKANSTIKQSLGVDQNVDYKSLVQYGPWDDRNYQLTKKDLAILPIDDQYLGNVPVFYKILIRKHNSLKSNRYPRSTYQYFLINYGGILKDGVWNKVGLGRHYNQDNRYGDQTKPQKTKLATNETALEAFGDELTIECNPLNKNNCVAGSNSDAGVSMFYSSDSGITWTKSQTNAGSCCDPSIDWSSDGSIVYQADLGAGGNSGGVRWSRSLDQGVTWEPMHDLTTSISDREFIHVDRSPTSPHKDNIYITYHDDNILQFSRSTDKGVTFSTPLAFNDEPDGIGGDITTDAEGNIYFIYPSPDDGIIVIKSTNGGVSFTQGQQISAIRGNGDLALPAMETRTAAGYVTADADMNNGNIYAAWMDEAPDSPGNNMGPVSANHALIQVAKSTDKGASWSLCPNPHDTSDTVANNPVDRFNQWMKVGEDGTIHIGYYDTRHSVNRTGVDFYYTKSTNSCVSWDTETRFTTETSVNVTDGSEWGDYNGMSVVSDRLLAGFTDNRVSNGKSVMVASQTLTGIPDDVIFKSGFDSSN